LKIFGLQGRMNNLAKHLPYGELRKLEIARALATKPKLLLLDEPAAGMNPREVGNLMELIHSIREMFNVTILLVEHQMKVVMGICERIKVMDFGETIAEGNPDEIRNDRKVIEAYLGSEGGKCLEVVNLEVNYGAIKALKNISFKVKSGQIVTLIGANGAGKSTTLRIISGLIKPKDGHIYFKGQEITNYEAHKIVELGISHVPEGRRIF